MAVRLRFKVDVSQMGVLLLIAVMFVAEPHDGVNR